MIFQTAFIALSLIPTAECVVAGFTGCTGFAVSGLISSSLPVWAAALSLSTAGTNFSSALKVAVFVQMAGRPLP